MDGLGFDFWISLGFDLGFSADDYGGVIVDLAGDAWERGSG